MKLYTKGERRYTEAKSFEILRAASEIFRDMGLDNQAALIFGAGEVLYAQNQREALVVAKTKVAQVKKPL